MASRSNYRVCFVGSLTICCFVRLSTLIVYMHPTSKHQSIPLDLARRSLTVDWLVPQRCVSYSSDEPNKAAT